jgi:cAMP-dependent protein kinase regulator
MVKPDPGKIKERASKYLQKGNWAKALESYEELEKITKKDLHVTQKIAELCRKLNQKDKAIKKYREAADLYRERGFVLQAVAMFKVILEIAPDDPEIKDALAQLAEQSSGSALKKKTPDAPLPRFSPDMLKTRPIEKPAENPAAKAEAPAPVPEGPADDELAMPAEEGPDEEIGVEGPDEGPAPEDDLGETADEGISLTADEPTAAATADDDYGMVSGLDEEAEPGPESAQKAQAAAPGPGAGEAEAEEEVEVSGPDEENLEEGPAAVAEEVEGADATTPPDCLEVAPIETEETLPACGPERTPLFSDLEKGEFERVFELLTSKLVNPGDVIVREGEPGDSIFVMARGEAAVSKRDEKGQDRKMALLSPCDFFGEIGYFYGSRQATVTALKKCLLLEISKADLDQVVAEFPRVKQVMADFYRERVLDNLMALSPLFSRLAPAERKQLGAAFVSRTFAPEEVIVQEGDPGESMFLIKLGEVVVTTLNPETNKEFELARLKGGEFFGEVGLVKNKPRTATIAAVIDTEVLELSRQDFQSVAAAHPEIGATLEQTIEQRVEDTIKKMLGTMDK